MALNSYNVHTLRKTHIKCETQKNKEMNQRFRLNMILIYPETLQELELR